MSREFEEHKIYVLLDFQGIETGLSNHESEYFRMMNLNETKPIVQFGEDIYEGTYEDSLGTNVFFEESEDDRLQNTNIFESKSPICLKYKLQQTKILKLKKIGTRQKNSYKMDPSEAMNVKFPENYKEVLEQYNTGTLNIENYVVEKDNDDKPKEESKTAQEEHQNNILAWYNEDCVTKEDSSIVPEELRQGTISTSTTKSGPFHEKYLNLEKLVQEPIKHHSIENYLSEKSIFSVSKAEFTRWKNHLLKNLEEYPIKLDIRKSNMGDFVDIENSIASGVIAPSNENPRVFSKEEKQKLLAFDNFINASPFLKLMMLKDYLCMFKSLMDKMTETELNKKVPDSFSISEKYQALQDFKKEFKSSIMLRLQSINKNEDINSTLKLKISEEKDYSDDDAFDSEWENSLSDSEEDNIN